MPIFDFFQHLITGNNTDHQLAHLIERAVNVHEVNDSRQTALIMACIYGKKRLVPVLLRKGSPLQIQDMYGQTALHKAAYYGHPTIVRQLLQVDKEARKKQGYQSIANIQDAGGNTAMHSCMMIGELGEKKPGGKNVIKRKVST